MAPTQEADLQQDVGFSAKVLALINTAGLDPEVMEMEDFCDRAVWIFHTAWNSFHPEMKRDRTLKFFGDRESDTAALVAAATGSRDNNTHTRTSNISDDTGKMREVLEGLEAVHRAIVQQAEAAAAAVDSSRPPAHIGTHKGAPKAASMRPKSASAAGGGSRDVHTTLAPILTTSGSSSKAALRTPAVLQSKQCLTVLSTITSEALVAGEPGAVGQMVGLLFREGQRLYVSANGNAVPGAGADTSTSTSTSTSTGAGAGAGAGATLIGSNGPSSNTPTGSYAKKQRPKSAGATPRPSRKAQEEALTRLMGPSAAPGTLTKKDMIQNAKRAKLKDQVVKKLEAGRSCDIPANPYVKHLTTEPPPEDLTIMSNVNRMKLRIQIMREMRVGKGISPGYHPRTPPAGSPGLDKSKQDFSPSNRKGNSPSSPLASPSTAGTSSATASVAATATATSTNTGTNTGVTSIADMLASIDVGPPSPITKKNAKKSQPDSKEKTSKLGGPAEDLAYFDRYGNFGAFLLDKLKRKARGSSNAVEEENPAKMSIKKKKKKKVRRGGAFGSQAPGVDSDIAVDTAFAVEEYTQQELASNRAIRRDEALAKKKAADQKARAIKLGTYTPDPVVPAPSASVPRIRGRNSVMEGLVGPGIFKPGMVKGLGAAGANKARTLLSVASEGGLGSMHEGEESETSTEGVSNDSESSDADGADDSSVIILGGGVGETIPKVAITGGALYKKRRNHNKSGGSGSGSANRGRPKTAPLSRSAGSSSGRNKTPEYSYDDKGKKLSIFDKLHQSSSILPKNADVLNTEFLRSLGLDETYPAFQATCVPATDTTLKVTKPEKVIVDGVTMYVSYDYKSGRRKLLSEEQMQERDAQWAAKNVPVSDAEVAAWQEGLDTTWRIIPPKSNSEASFFKNSNPTKAQWPGFNTGKRTSEWVQRARRDVLTEKFSQVNGNSTNHTTNYALSSFAKRTAKLLATPQARAEFCELSKQTAPLDLLICVEHCHSCHTHNMSNKHDVRQYVNLADAFLKLLVETCHSANVCCRVGVSRYGTLLQEHLPPSSGKASGGGNQLEAFTTSKDKQGEMQSRIGAFEIMVMYRAPTSSSEGKGGGESSNVSNNDGLVAEILHSKLTTMRWPARSVVEKRLLSFLSKFNVPARDTRLEASELSALLQEEGGTDGLCTYPVGPFVPLDNIKVSHSDWNFPQSGPAPAPDVSPQELAKLRVQARAQKLEKGLHEADAATAANVDLLQTQTLDHKEVYESVEKAKAEAEVSEDMMRSAALTTAADESEATFTPHMKVSGDPRRLSSPKHPGGARSYGSQLAPNTSTKQSRSRSPSPTGSPLKGGPPPSAPRPQRTYPVQWAFDSRAAAGMHVYRKNDEVYVLTAPHPRGGKERHPLKGKVISVSGDSGTGSALPGAPCDLEVMLSYHEKAISLHSSACAKEGSAYLPHIKSYAVDTLPAELGLLLHFFAESDTPIWKALAPGDKENSERQGCVYLCRSSFFHQVRNAAMQAEQVHGDKTTGLITHPLTGDDLDLQLAYSEGTLDWAFGRSGDTTDMHALQHLANIQYNRMENEILLAQEMKRQKALAQEAADAAATAEASAQMAFDAEKERKHQQRGAVEAAASTTYPPANSHAAVNVGVALEVPLPTASGNPQVGRISPRASTAAKNSTAPTHRDLSPRPAPPAAAAPPAATAVAASEHSGDAYSDDGYDDEDFDAPTPAAPSLAMAAGVINASISLEESALSVAAGGSSDNITGLHESGSSDNQHLTTASQSQSVSVAGAADRPTEASGDTNRTDDARHDVSVGPLPSGSQTGQFAVMSHQKFANAVSTAGTSEGATPEGQEEEEDSHKGQSSAMSHQQFTTETESERFKVGEAVEGNYGGNGSWYQGKIMAVHAPESSGGRSTYDVVYDDGDKEFKVPASCIRALTKASAAGSLSSFAAMSHQTFDTTVSKAATHTAVVKSTASELMGVVLAAASPEKGSSRSSSPVSFAAAPVVLGARTGAEDVLSAMESSTNAAGEDATEGAGCEHLTSQVSVSLSNFLGNSDSGSSDMSAAAVAALVKQHSSPSVKSGHEEAHHHEHHGNITNSDADASDTYTSPTKSKSSSGVQIVRELQKSPRSVSPESSLESPLHSAGPSAVLPASGGHAIHQDDEEEYGDDEWDE